LTSSSFVLYDDRQGTGKPDTVQARYDFRLEDLLAFHLVRAHCQACGHKAIIPNAALQRGQPGYTRLTSLQRRLRCRRCGAKGKALLEMEFQPRD
jgi:hypothetical protein